MFLIPIRLSVQWESVSERFGKGTFTVVIEMKISIYPRGPTNRSS